MEEHERTKFEEALSIMEEINELGFEKVGRTFLDITTNGYATSILLCEEQIWNSQDDERETDEDGNYTMPLKTFILGQMFQFADDINKLRE